MNAKHAKKEETTESIDTPSSEDAVETVEAMEVTEEQQLRERLAELEAKNQQLEDTILRDRAEVENFKRRSRQEQDNALKFASQSLISNMLPVLDGFDRAMSTVDMEDEAALKVVKGFEMIATLLKQTLEQEGLAEINCVGQVFDPYCHQAVMQATEEEYENNIVLEELQKGYTLKDRVIRASMVKVNNK